MKRTVIAGLGAAMIATLAAGGAAEAATIDFGVTAFDGSIGYTGSSLDQSTLLDLDLSFLVVNEVFSDDQSGLALFDPISLSAMTSPPSSQIIYGSGTGPGPLGADVILSWPTVVGPGTDVFTETLTTVMSVNRGTTDQIGLKLTGTVSDFRRIIRQCASSAQFDREPSERINRGGVHQHVDKRHPFYS